MARILALDIGDRRVGTALADSNGRHLHPHLTFDRLHGLAEKEIIKLVTEMEIRLIVVGLPLSENGQKNEQCSKVENFCRRLKRRIDAEIVYVDEYLSSVEAIELLRLNPKRERIARRKGTIDAVSASIILRSYFTAKESV